MALLVAFALIVSAGTATAAPAEKVDVCHLEGTGDYHLISISDNAYPSHVDHGDAMIGEPVPGVEGKKFDEDCNVVDAGPVVEPGYNPDAVLLTGSRWRNFRVDGNGWELAVGDPSSIGSYNSGWTNLDFTYAADYYFSPNTNHFTFSYDAITGDQTIEAVVNGGTFSKTQNNGNVSPLNYMQIDVVGRDGQTVKFENVVLTVNGMNYSLQDFSAGGWLTWQINNFDLSSGFSIAGDIELVGQATSQEGSKLNVSAGYVGP
jgi:hypothetical protein